MKGYQARAALKYTGLASAELAAIAPGRRTRSDAAAWTA
jgi:hypothetical protein